MYIIFTNKKKKINQALIKYFVTFKKCFKDVRNLKHY